ncbi:MAG: aldo/keto reductase [Nitrospirota bacterium]
MKLGLGTVQFGLDYGISNQGGQTTENEAAGILALAASKGVQIIDTAVLYGSSEQVLGRVLPANHRFQIVTKTPRFANDRADGQVLEDACLRSLNYLKQDSLYGLLVHHADDLLAPGGNVLMERMVELKRRGLVRKIGASVYTASQIDGIMDRFAIDLVQLPVNVLDQRLIRSGHLAKLKKAGVEIHARSVFLQGLLLMEARDLPPYFTPVRGHLEDYHVYLRERGISPLRAALGFAAGIPEIDVIVCGVNDRMQLNEIIANAAALDPADFARFAVTDEAMVDPSRWQTGDRGGGR